MLTIKTEYNILNYLRYKMSYVWWYYNKKSSKTGGIYQTREDCIRHAKNDGFITCNFVGNEHEQFEFLIKKIRLYGNFKFPLYILSYPNAVYDNKKEAMMIGFRYINEKSPKFYWSGANDWDRNTQTLCDLRWMKTVSKSEILDWEKIWEARIDGDQLTTPNHIETVSL